MTTTTKRWSVVAALGSIYLIWGSTFLAIRFAIDTIPPLTMAGLRFAAAGLLLVALCRLRGQRSPWDWPAILAGGVPMVALGNGTVSWSQTLLPSGLAALLVAAVPLWVVLLEALVLTRRRPRTTVLAGIALGAMGMLVLVGPGLRGLQLPEGAAVAAGFVLVGSLGWAAGSLYLSRRSHTALLPLLSRQLLAGGTTLLLIAVWTGEAGQLDLAAASRESWLSLAYLVVVGTLVGYSAYVWLLRTTAPALVGTYAFVNPVVALMLGAWLGNEQLTPMTGVAAGLIVAAVTLVCWPTSSRSKRQRLPLYPNPGPAVVARDWKDGATAPPTSDYGDCMAKKKVS